MNFYDLLLVGSPLYYFTGKDCRHKIKGAPDRFRALRRHPNGALVVNCRR